MVPAAPETQPAIDQYAAVVQPSEEATTLLRRAEEGAGRQDWKLAVDSLQRIVELPGEHVLTSDGRVYESARRQALMRIAKLPAEGLAVYRLVHDGEAAALLAKGQDEHDEALLRTVVDRYLCTKPGEQAAVTLADWLIDEGRFSEAAGVLQQLKAIYPDPQLPAWLVPSRMAVCAAGLGQQQRAKTLLAGVERQVSSAPAEEKGMGVVSRSGPDAFLKALDKFVSQAVPQTAEEGAGSWPMAMGNPARDGQLAPIEPSFVDYAPWTVSLISSDSRASQQTVRDYALREHLLPVRQMVTDGKTLLVKGDRELMAFDADSFMPLWTGARRSDAVADNAAAEQAEFAFPAENLDPQSAIDAQLRNEPAVVRMLHDSVGGSVTVAFGLALTVEWAREPAVLRQGQPGGVIPGVDFFDTTYPSRILAYSLADGHLVWKSDVSVGRSERAAAAEARRRVRPTQGPVPGAAEASDGDMEFLASPVPVGQFLLAPCRVNGDLHAAILDPASGKLVRDIYLCGAGGGAFDSLNALQPCVTDGAVFIPTGRGLFIAVQASDWSLRWAARYERPSGYVPGIVWLPTPAIAVADVVLQAPTDSDQLFCYDRNSGELRWKADGKPFWYVLGANDRHVWVAGRDVAMINIEDGSTAWTYKGSTDPTGRGIVAGDRVYVPTAAGLIALEAETGKPIKLDFPLEPPVLGNLLAWDGALYSLSAFDVRKYPDLTRGYQEAVARHEQDRADPSRAIRLACLEMLKHQPAKAMAALQGVKAEGKAADRYAGQVAHLRVRAMLEMVAAGDLAAERSLELLRLARQTARTPQDAIESALALGEYQAGRGEKVEGCLQYLTLVFSADGDQMLTSESGLQQRARTVAVQRIASALKGLPEADARKVQAAIAERYQQALGRGEPASLWLAESTGLGEIAQEAALALGKAAAKDLRFEQAESYFQRVVRHAHTPELIAEGSARLARVYLEPEELHQPVSALALIGRLEHELAGIAIPADAVAGEAALEPERAPAKEASSSPNSGKITGVQAAALLRKRIDPKVMAAHQAALGAVALGAPEKPAERAYPGARTLYVRGGRTEPLADEMLLLTDGNHVEARDIASGKMIWPAELRLLGDVAVEPRRLDAPGGAISMRTDLLGRARGLVSGETLIVNTEFGIHAVGLRTGVRLWARRFDPPGGGEVAGSDACIWTDDGYLVSVDAQHHLDVASVAQGERLLWRCSRPSRSWGSVRARNGFVVAVDDRLQEVDIFGLADGRPLGECHFKQPEGQSQINLTLYDEVLCGPASPNQVVAYDLAAPGVERWRAEAPGGVGQIFKPDPNLLAIADRRGGVQILEPATGRKVAEAKVESCGEGLIDGAVVNGIAYVYGFKVRPSDRNRSDQQRWVVAAIRLEDGRVLWQQANLAPRTFLSEELMSCSSNAIPLVSFQPQGRPDLQLGNNQFNPALESIVEVQLLDKTTGQLTGERMAAPLRNENGVSRILDVQVWPGQILVAAGNTYLAFPMSGGPATQSAQSGNLQSRREHRASGLSGWRGGAAQMDVWEGETMQILAEPVTHVNVINATPERRAQIGVILQELAETQGEESKQPGVQQQERGSVR